jgi:hypothetical protein
MYRYLIIALALALALTACGPKSTFKQPANLLSPSPAEYPFHYGSPYIDMFWHCMSPEGGGISIAGYVMTSTNQNLPPQNFSVILKAFNAKGQKLTERFTYGDNLSPGQFQPVPLGVSLPAVSGVARYDLYYSFVVVDGREKLQQFGTVNDVCGGRYRRKEVPPGS